MQSLCTIKTPECGSPSVSSGKKSSTKKRQHRGGDVGARLSTFNMRQNNIRTIISGVAARRIATQLQETRKFAQKYIIATMK